VSFAPASGQPVASSAKWIYPARFARLPSSWIQGNLGANPASRTANSWAHAPGFTNLNDITPNGVWVDVGLSPRRPTSPAPSQHRPLRLPLNLRYPHYIAKQEGSSLSEYRFAGRYRSIYFVDVRVDFGRRNPTRWMRQRAQTVLSHLRLSPRLVSRPASCG
jgi:hypothetical protein